MLFRGFRYRLDPTLEEDILFRQFAGVCRLVYNLALEQRHVANLGKYYRQADVK
jgi:putative transposase